MAKRKQGCAGVESIGASSVSRGRTRRKIDDTVKMKVALEALKEAEPLSVLAGRFGVHATQISQWRKQLLANAETVFSGRKDADHELALLRDERDGYAKKVGELTMDVEFLKKNLSKLGLL